MCPGVSDASALSAPFQARCFQTARPVLRVLKLAPRQGTPLRAHFRPPETTADRMRARSRAMLSRRKAREFTNGGLVKGCLAIWLVFNTLIAKPPFTKPPFVNSRVGRCCQDVRRGREAGGPAIYVIRMSFISCVVSRRDMYAYTISYCSHECIYSV